MGGSAQYCPLLTTLVRLVLARRATRPGPVRAVGPWPIRWARGPGRQLSSAWPGAPNVGHGAALADPRATLAGITARRTLARSPMAAAALPMSIVLVGR